MKIMTIQARYISNVLYRIFNCDFIIICILTTFYHHYAMMQNKKNQRHVWRWKTYKKTHRETQTRDQQTSKKIGLTKGKTRRNNIENSSIAPRERVENKENIGKKEGRIFYAGKNISKSRYGTKHDKDKYQHYDLRSIPNAPTLQD